jgi:hypothetical protein
MCLRDTPSHMFFRMFSYIPPRFHLTTSVHFCQEACPRVYRRFSVLNTKYEPTFFLQIVTSIYIYIYDLDTIFTDSYDFGGETRRNLAVRVFGFSVGSKRKTCVHTGIVWAHVILGQHAGR